MDEFIQTPHKIDICFWDCLKDLKSNNKFMRFFFIFRIALITYHIVDHLQQQISPESQSTFNKVSILYILMILFNTITFIYSNWIYYKFLSNHRMIYHIAHRIDHAQIIYEQQNLQSNHQYISNQNTQNLKVSRNMYEFATNLELQDVDEEYKKRSQRNCRALIIQNMELNNLFKCLNQLFNVLSLALFVYGVIVLSLGSQYINPNDYSFILSYLVSQVAIRLLVYLIILIIGLSPVFCIIFCVYSYCFNKNQKIQLPPPQQATLDVIRECQGDCPICYQNIKQKEEIVVLRCSPKHVFHDLCIKGWTKIGKTCPICREPI